MGNVASYFSDEILRLLCYFEYIQRYHVSLDYIESNIYKPDPPKIKRKPPENIFYVTFSNMNIEMINLPAMFYNKSILVTNKCNFITPTVVYDLTALIHSELFNFDNFVSEHDIDVSS